MDQLRTESPGPNLAKIVDRSGYRCSRIAREIISVIPNELISRFEEFPDRLQFRIAQNHDGWQVQRVILARESLEKLDGDPSRDVKIEYLKRELANAARTRRVWTYPRTLALR